jgi:hypothetical protein
MSHYDERGEATEGRLTSVHQVAGSSRGCAGECLASARRRDSRPSSFPFASRRIEDEETVDVSAASRRR